MQPRKFDVGDEADYKGVTVKLIDISYRDGQYHYLTKSEVDNLHPAWVGEDELEHPVYAEIIRLQKKATNYEGLYHSALKGKVKMADAADHWIEVAECLAAELVDFRKCDLDAEGWFEWADAAVRKREAS